MILVLREKLKSLSSYFEFHIDEFGQILANTKRTR